MDKLWNENAWEEYLYWQREEKKIVKKINALIKDIERNGVSEGIGHPEPLKYMKYWSRHIDHCNRLVYNIIDNAIIIISCKGHYDD